MTNAPKYQGLDRRMYPPIDYHLEILCSNGAHGDYAADTPFPAISVGDVLVPASFVTGGTMGVSSDQEQVVIRVEHHLAIWGEKEPNIFQHVTTVVFTEVRPRKLPFEVA